MDITFPNLQSINDGVSTAFNSQLWAAATVQDKFAFQAASTGAAEYYPRLNMLPGLREWLGDRVVHGLSTTTFSIPNKTFEETIGIRREDIEDDKFGILTPIAGELGAAAARLPDLLVAQLMKGGHTSIIYDGQNFFDTAHPDFTGAGSPNGVPNTTSPNYVSGSGPAPWFLLDVSRALKGFIFQRRRPFQVVPRVTLTDENVFSKNEFQWGVDGRCAAGYGIWQLAYMSTQPVTVENVLAGRTQMASYRRPDGAPMGVLGTLLVGGSTVYPSLKAIAENMLVPNTLTNAYSGSTTVTNVPNQAFGMFKAMENVWLN